jgi:hypothetical protein
MLSHRFFKTENQTEMNSDIITAFLPKTKHSNFSQPVNFTIQHKKVNRLTLIHPYLHSSIHSYLHSSIHTFTQPTIPAPIHPYLHPSINTFTHPSIHSPIHPYLHPSIDTSTHPSIPPPIVCPSSLK